MIKCLCGVPLSGRQRLYCSISCRNRVNGEKTGGWNKNRATLVCSFCSKEYEVPQCRKGTSRHCSRQCHNTAISREWDHSGKRNPMWKGGIQTYRRFKKEACERCLSREKIMVHHKDGNRYNNVLSNLETLCRSCHAKEHGIEKNFIS